MSRTISLLPNAIEMLIRPNEDLPVAQRRRGECAFAERIAMEDFEFRLCSEDDGFAGHRRGVDLAVAGHERRPNLAVEALAPANVAGLGVDPLHRARFVDHID